VHLSPVSAVDASGGASASPGDVDGLDAGGGGWLAPRRQRTMPRWPTVWDFGDQAVSGMTSVEAAGVGQDDNPDPGVGCDGHLGQVPGDDAVMTDGAVTVLVAGDASRPSMAHTDREGAGPVDGVGAAEELWEALARARAEYAPELLAATEDAVVRFYLPLARTLAGAVAPRRLDHFEAEHAAVVALAHAVLAWQDSAREGFDAFARAAVNSQLRFLAAAENQIWPDRGQGGARPTASTAPPAALSDPAPVPRPRRERSGDR